MISSRNIIKIYLSIIIIILLLVTSLPAFIQITKVNSSILPAEEILDQKQELHNRESPIRNGLLIAQEFKPSKTPLTKVMIKIRKTLVIQEPLIVSIRKDLNDFDLTFIPVLGSQIPFNTFWVEFDFEDIEVDVEDTYYIVVRSPASQSFWWQNKINDSIQGDPYNRGKLWQSNNNGIDWEYLDSSNFYFDCTFKTFTYDSKPDLQCNGTLSWTNLSRKQVVTGSFTIENSGTPLSYLDWKIYSWPSWGEWTFSTLNGTNLKPEDGPLTIQVTVQAPNISNTQYSGGVKIINLNDDEDFCIIDSSLATPKSIPVCRLKIFKIIRNLNEFIFNYILLNFLL